MPGPQGRYPSSYPELEEEQQQEMQDWIDQVQKYNGLPQEAIDSLLTIEFEGEQEM